MYFRLGDFILLPCFPKLKSYLARQNKALQSLCFALALILFFVGVIALVEFLRETHLMFNIPLRSGVVINQYFWLCVRERECVRKRDIHTHYFELCFTSRNCSYFETGLNFYYFSSNKKDEKMIHRLQNNRGIILRCTN